MGSTPQFSFSPCPDGGIILKLTASLSAGRSSRPRPPAPSFLLEEKKAKDHSGGVCGLPLKTPGGSLRSQRYIRYEPRVRVCAGWYALTVPGAAQRCGTSFQRLVCVDPPVRKCLRISERVRAYGAHKGPRSARPFQGSTVVSIWPSGHSVAITLPGQREIG